MTQNILSQVTPNPDNIKDTLSLCQTKEEAFQSVMRIPLKERLKMGNILGNREDFPFLKDAPSYATYGGRFSLEFPYVATPPEPFTKDKLMARSPTKEDAIRIYTELFEYIANKIIESRITNKPLLLLKGEAHVDRGANSLNEMILDIIQRLGVKHIGIETAEEKELRDTLDGRRVSAHSLNGLLTFFEENANNGILPETHPESLPPEGVLHNTCQFAPPLLKNEKITTFPIDKNNKNLNTPEGMWDERESFMLKKIEEYAAGKDVLISCGLSHLHGLNPSNRTIGAINTSQSNFIQLIQSNTKPEREKPPEAFHPHFQTGWVHSFKEAKELATVASREVGDVLEEKFTTLLTKVRKEATKGNLTTVHLGGRAQNPQKQQRT